MSSKARLSISGEVSGTANQIGNVQGDVHFSTSPGVRWPVHVGVVPRQADCYQDRPTTDLSGLTVLRGMGGVGKTQTAAHHARASQQDPDVDLVVWITATSREAVVAGYAEAAALLQISTSDADTVVLSWLQTTPRRWLIVLDDVADPSVLRDLWPPITGTGQILVTTRRKDSALARADSSLIDINVFTAEQSQAYLDAKLAAHADLQQQPRRRNSCCPTESPFWAKIIRARCRLGTTWPHARAWQEQEQWLTTKPCSPTRCACLDLTIRARSPPATTSHGREKHR